MGAKSFKCSAVSAIEKSKRSLPPVTHHNAIEENEYVTFLSELAVRTDRQKNWMVYCTETDRDVATQIPYRSTLALRFDAYKAVLHDSRAPIDILPALTGKPLSFYQTTVQMKGSSILLNGIVYQAAELPYKLTLERIHDDPVYAYQGSLIVGPDKPIDVYLKHTTQSIFRRYFKLKRSDSNELTEGADIFWKLGEQPADFIKWSTSEGHVVLADEEGKEFNAFIKDCYRTLDCVEDDVDDVDTSEIE